VLPKALARDEIEAMLGRPRPSSNRKEAEAMAARDRAMLEVFLCAALRVSEIMRRQAEDFEHSAITRGHCFCLFAVRSRARAAEPCFISSRASALGSHFPLLRDRYSGRIMLDELVRAGDSDTSGSMPRACAPPIAPAQDCKQPAV